MTPGNTILTQAQIRTRVRELGAAITRHYQKSANAREPVLFLGVMNGALFFLADLLRCVDLDIEISCVQLTSYAGMKSTGKVCGLEALGESFRDRHVLIVDDILDTGHTLSALVSRLKKLGAPDIKICVLLEKRVKRRIPIKPDWVGFKIADKFVVGYGLDYRGRYRTLKRVMTMQEQTRS